jgi:hypothetical protein
LESVVTSEDFDDLSAKAAQSVHSVDWSSAGAKVDTMIRRAVMDPTPLDAKLGATLQPMLQPSL